MRKLSNADRDQLIADIRRLFKQAVSDEYYMTILNSHDGIGGSGSSIMVDIVQDVLTCSAWEESGYYCEDDIRLAIGRVLMERIGIEY